MKFVSVLLLALLVFGSVVSANVSVCEFFDYTQENEQSNFDEENQSNDADCCDYYCNCVKQFSNRVISTDSVNANSLIKPLKIDIVVSQFPPPLLRPPIT